MNTRHHAQSRRAHITDDTGRFLDWEGDGRSVAGWYEFRSDGRRLNVKNINVSTAESTTGADLVYISRDPDSVVLVQYKVLEQYKSGEYYFRDDGRLASQVSRMLSFSASALDRGDVEVDSRLGLDIAFVKFVEPGSLAARSGSGIPGGQYFPVDAVRRMFKSPDKGPGGGDVFYVLRRRSIDGETFAKSTRDRWIGSDRMNTVLLKKILNLTTGHRSLTVAIDEPGSVPEVAAARIASSGENA